MGNIFAWFKYLPLAILKIKLGRKGGKKESQTKQIRGFKNISCYFFNVT